MDNEPGMSTEAVKNLAADLETTCSKKKQKGGGGPGWKVCRLRQRSPAWHTTVAYNHILGIIWRRNIVKHFFVV